MNHVERFRAVMSFKPIDRLPRWELAMWWDKTIKRWHNEGFPKTLAENDIFGISQYVGLDPYIQFWFSASKCGIEACQHPIHGSVKKMEDYLALKPYIFPDHTRAIDIMYGWANRQKEGDVVVWTTLEGFFWFPRSLMDIERLSYAYYDQPELIHAMNSDLLAFNLNLRNEMEKRCIPTFTTIAEDMSYNLGPMISEQVFNDFIRPYYRKLFDRLDEMGVFRIIDTDGDVTIMVPWLKMAGAHGILPLERQAGVDGMKLRNQFPDLCMVGHFDKMGPMDETYGERAAENELVRIQRMRALGGDIDFIDVDSAMRNLIHPDFGDPLFKVNTGFSPEEAVREFVDYMLTVHRSCPDVKFFEIVNFPLWGYKGKPSYSGDMLLGDFFPLAEAIIRESKRRGAPLAGITVDFPYEMITGQKVPWARIDPGTTDWVERVKDLEAYVKSEGLQFNLVVNSGNADKSQEQSYKDTLAYIDLYTKRGGHPNRYIIQSWFKHPSGEELVPEDAPYTLTALVKEVILRVKGSKPVK